MNVSKLLADLRQHQVMLSVDGEHLRCSAPRGVLTPELQAQISAHKAELMALLRAIVEPAPHTFSSIPPVDRGGRLQLSFAQQRLWFLQQLEPTSSALTIALALELKGRLNILALEQSLTEIVRRHEILRTNYPVRAGRPYQVVGPTQPFALPLIDLTALLPERQDRVVVQLAREEAQRPFDLQRGPILRLRLLRCRSDRHVLLLSRHHIASDGWSLGIFVHELSLLYPAYACGQAAALAELPVQYADFAAWQREQRSDQHWQQQIAYWQEQLAGAPPVLDLQPDQPRGILAAGLAATQHFVLDAEIVARLTALAHAADTTPFTVMLAAFTVLLQRYSGQHDLVVGTPVAGRIRSELEPLIGCFVNMLPLRVNLSGIGSFRELIQQVRTVTLHAFAHQAIPFEELVEAIRPERSLSHTPLFQVVFAFQNTPLEPMVLPDLDVTIDDPTPVTAKYNLVWTASQDADRISCVLEYNTALYVAATIEQMGQLLQQLIAELCNAPDLPLAALADLKLKQPAVARSESPAIGCIHSLFAAQVLRHPHAIAVTYGDQQLSYSALNARAEQLAQILRGHGVGPEVIVGLIVEPSIELIVGMLAILMAGGAYLPIDPAAPAKRIAATLADAQARLVVTMARLVERLEDYSGAQIILDRPLPAPPPNTPGTQATPDNLAYIIYTSGSTGVPKGVMNTHANVTRLFAATQSWFNFDNHDTWTLFHSSAFDFSVWEIWGALLHGGRLVIVPQDVTRSPQDFWQLLVQEQVTVLNQTPSAFRQLLPVALAAAEPAQLALRLIIFGGEALDIHHLSPWWERYGDTRPRLINMYGITETTVHVTYAELTRTEVHTANRSPLGIAIPDLELVVLDADGRQTLAGMRGEIWVGGAGLARGYLNRPDLTADRFRPDHLSRTAGGRLYRSGDLVHLLADGTLNYLGRLDQQVKLRGFRIELGEIEAQLLKQPGIRDAVVIVRQDNTQPYLAAYIVPGGATVPPPSALHQALAQQLPEYMVPVSYIPLEQLPLTPHGKLDRGALPAPDRKHLITHSQHVAPRNATEQALVAIWEDLLGVDNIGVEDNFFDLGGHSLLVTQFLSRLPEVFQVEIPLRSLFNTPTIASLASVIAEEQRRAEEQLQQMLNELEQLSDEEINRRLAEG